MENIVRVGVGVFVVRDGKFLIGKRKGAHGAGTWSLIGGHMEMGESIEQTAIREVMEETGLEIKNIKVSGVTNDIFTAEDKHYITIWVTSEWKKGKASITEPDKFLSLTWHTFKTLPDNLFLPWVELQKSDFYKKIKRALKSSL